MKTHLELEEENRKLKEEVNAARFLARGLRNCGNCGTGTYDNCAPGYHGVCDDESLTQWNPQL